MLFNNAVFLLAFLPVSYGVFWTLRRTRARYIWSAVTGYVFSVYWDARFGLSMLFSTPMSYGAAIAMQRSNDQPKRRTLCMVIPIVRDLGRLGIVDSHRGVMKPRRSFFDAAGMVLQASGRRVSCTTGGLQ